MYAGLYETSLYGSDIRNERGLQNLSIRFDSVQIRKA